MFSTQAQASCRLIALRIDLRPEHRNHVWPPFDSCTDGASEAKKNVPRSRSPYDFVDIGSLYPSGSNPAFEE